MDLFKKGFAALLFLGSLLHAQTYAVVNGEALTDEDLKPMVSMFRNATHIDELDVHERAMLIDQGIEKKLIVQDANRQKLEKDPKFKEALKAFEERLKVEFWMKKHFDTLSISKEEIEAYFKNHKADFPKDATLQEVEAQVSMAAKMEKFQKQTTELLSHMKKTSKIIYRK